MNDALTQRTLQLIAKHESLVQTNLALEAECADLKNRLAMASQRVEAMLARLPVASASITSTTALADLADLGRDL
jgi:hypothetical protein